MASEITLNVSLRVANGLMEEQFGPVQDQIDQSAIGVDGGVREIGTTEETISLTDVSTPGYAIFRNLDSTNFVTIGPDSGGSMVDFLKLKPGEIAVLRLAPDVSIKAKADTAAVKLLVRVYAD